ncbi:MAG TPA: D-inositol-3-phosphate glycosyltransferase, partial [Actinomycetota bacterium]
METFFEQPVRRVGVLSVHSSPLAPPGVGDSGGMNVTVRALAGELAR